jgi:hypothetical protein
MFDNLLDLVKEHAGDAIVNNNAIPNDRNNEAVEIATHSIFDGLRQSVQSGNVSDLSQLFNTGGDVASSPVAQNIQGNFIQRLMQKFGLSNAQAGGIASSLIPSVLQKLVHKTNDPNDSSFSLQSILGHLGGSGFDVNSILNKLGGGGGQEGHGLDSLKNVFGN